MTRFTKLAIAAIAALVGASVLGIWLATRDAGPRPAPLAPVAVAPDPPPPDRDRFAGGPLPPLPTGGPPAFTGPPVPVAAPERPRERYVLQDPRKDPQGPVRDWPDLPVLDSTRSLGQVGAQLKAGLARAEPRLADCFAAGKQGGGAAPRMAPASDPVEQDPSGPRWALELETRDGSVIVVDAPVATAFGASNAALACVQDRLRGMQLEAPAAKAGHRFRLRYQLRGR